ncbi:hypothetical protein AB0I39_29565 [Kitasatospora purpeofusca]|uniref:hypothetical protein n=1 Tax=Kitasatospora purpeofusca TaxID=67352 RepID=UPI0033CC9103
MGERTEWTARNGKTVEVDYPVPARTVVLTVAVDGLEEITVLAGGPDGTGLHRGKGAWSVLVPPDRQEELRRITVVAQGTWRLRLLDPAEATALVDEVVGHGSQLLAFTGGTEVAEFEQGAADQDARLFRLVRLTEDGGREVLATNERSYGLAGRTDHTVLLEGRRLLVVEQGGAWSVIMRPAALPPSTKKVRHGIGDGREVFVRPDRGRPALLEIEPAQWSRTGSFRLGLADHDGQEFDDHRIWLINGRQRVLLWGGRRDASLGSVTVRTEDCHTDWRQTLLPLKAARELAGRVDGQGYEVLRRSGPPALLRVRQTGRDAGFLSVRAGGVRVSAGDGREFCGTVPVGFPEADRPELVEVQSSGRWRLETVPPTAAPAFDREVSGVGCAVVRWTGGEGRLTARSAGDQSISAVVLDDRLNRLGRTVGHGSRFDRSSDEPARLQPGCLVAVEDGFHAGWRLAVR